jgi:hypothetical protein
VTTFHGRDDARNRDRFDSANAVVTTPTATTDWKTNQGGEKVSPARLPVAPPVSKTTGITPMLVRMKRMKVPTATHGTAQYRPVRPPTRAPTATWAPTTSSVGRITHQRSG